MASLQSKKGIIEQCDSDDGIPSNGRSDIIPYSLNGDSDLKQVTTSHRSFSKNPNHGNWTKGWWTVGKSHGIPLIHKNFRMSVAGNRVFSSNQEDLWDLTDSVLELYETEHRLESILHHGHRKRPVDIQSSSIRDWVARDTSNGFIRVYHPDISNFTTSQLVPCSLNTSVQKICNQLGLSSNTLHVQLHRDVIRRLDPPEIPLLLQNDFLASLGYTNIVRIQEEGHKEELAYLIKFYSGKPMPDNKDSRNQLKAFMEIKKGGLLQQWVGRLCVFSGTRLLIYKDKQKSDEPLILELAKGSVEEVKMKGHELCLKLTSALQGDKQVFLSFTNGEDFGKWMNKCKMATDRLPTAADLSNWHLEYLPENIFINDQLAMLNLHHNTLKQRPTVDGLDMIGWIEDLTRFSCLRSLNLADNHLETFPPSLCSISTLMELNMANNQLTEIPPEIQQLTNLRALHIHNNHLTVVPEQLLQLRCLFVLVLAFNRFASLPPVVAQMTNVRYSEVENIIMTGNQIEKISSETLVEMKHVKRLDLRLNQLILPTTETMKFTILEHLSHLDIRDNQVVDLDIRVIRTLEYLNCERNAISSLHLNGTSLKYLFAASNCLEHIQISPKPEWLQQIDVSDNYLESLPDWICDCFFLQKIVASKNFLHVLPSRIFSDAKKLKCLQVGHNQLTSLPTEIESLCIEELQLQDNYLPVLPQDLLRRANKLKILNVTKNRLTHLPPLNENLDLNKVQELYLSGNHFDSSVMEIVSGYPHLKVLHLAQNELTELSDSLIQKLQLLQELNVSTNQLHSLPDSLGNLSKLVMLRVHSNNLSTLPDFHNAKSMRVLDVSHNNLFRLSLASLIMPSQFHLLDMNLNSQLKINPKAKEFKTVKNAKSICLVDISGQNRHVPSLPQRNQVTNLDDSLSLDSSVPWKVGFSETAGIRDTLCITMILQLKFRSESDSLFAMFDGGQDDEVPKILMEIMAATVREEMTHHQTSEAYLKYSLLTAHRKLKLSGQHLGATALVCHLERHEASDQLNQFTLSIANVGDTEAVLCHRRETVVLTRKFTTTTDREECMRIYKSDGFITEDCKVNGITHNTRLLGCSYLSPLVIPNPFTATISLSDDDEFIIIANGQFWEHVSYEEAVEEVYEIGNPVVAAKHLQDLAQGYGARENIAVLVIRLNADAGPSLGQLRPGNREMSVDDREAVVQNEALKVRRALRVTRTSSNMKPMPEETSFPYGQKTEVKSLGGKTKSRQLFPFKSQVSQQSQSSHQLSQDGLRKKTKRLVDGPARNDGLQSVEGYVKNVAGAEKPGGMRKKAGEVSAFHTSAVPADPVAQKSSRPTLRQRFIKKTEWDPMATKRAPNDVKDELSRSSTPMSSIGRNSLLAGKVFMSGAGMALPRDETADSDLFQHNYLSSSPEPSDHFLPNPAYSYIPDVKEVEVIDMMAPSANQLRVRSSMADVIARFEQSAQQQNYHYGHVPLSPTQKKIDSQLLKKSALETHKKRVATAFPVAFKSSPMVPKKFAGDDQLRSRKLVIDNFSFESAEPSSQMKKQSQLAEDLNSTTGSVEANLYETVAETVEQPSRILDKDENQPRVSTTAVDFEEMEVLEDGQTKIIEIARL